LRNTNIHQTGLNVEEQEHQRQQQQVQQSNHLSPWLKIKLWLKNPDLAEINHFLFDILIDNVTLHYNSIIESLKAEKICQNASFIHGY
jgi:hypothetical protein